MVLAVCWRGGLKTLMLLTVTFHLLSVSMSTAEGLHYLSFQDDGQATSASWAMWGCPPPLSVFATQPSVEETCLNNSLNGESFSSFSVCYFFRMTSVNQENIAFSFISSNLNFEVGHSHNITMISDKDNTLAITLPADFMNWSPYCAVVSEGQTVALYKDGSLLKDFELQQQKSLSVNDFFVLGQSFTGEGRSSLAGEMADFQLWNVALTKEKVEKIASCVDVNPPPRVFLKRDQWLINGTTEWLTNPAVEDICQLQPFSDRSFIPTGEHSWQKGLKICKSYGGRLPLPVDNTSNALLANVVQLDRMSTQGIYLGIKKTPSGWTDAYTGETINYWPQRVLIQSPRANVCLDPNTNTWSEFENPQCLVVCEVPIQKVFLKGLCAASKFSKELWVHQSISGQLVLREAGTFILQANHPSDGWSLSSWWYTKTRATLKNKQSESPFGNRMWSVWDEECGYKGEMMPLMLTPCPKETFTCKDLSCVPVDNVCNGRMDCSDGGDEHCFNRVVVPQDYVMAPPRPIGTSPFSVVCGIEVINYRRFSIKEMVSEVDIILVLQWRDDRLKFLHLKDKLAPISHMLEHIWTPYFAMTSDLGLQANAEVATRSMTVMREGSAEPDDLSSLNGGVFLGSSVTIRLASRLVVTAACDPDLYKFPFDTQTCKLLISMRSGPESRLVEGNLTRPPFFRERLLEYYIRNMSLYIAGPETPEDESKVVLVTEFGHLYGYYAISIFMPTLLLVIVSYGSFYFEEDDFSDRIMVSLTSLLVLSTFISTASSSMARVSYFTYLDVWLSFCIVLVFCICVLQILLLSLIRYSKDCVEERTEQQWAKVSPGIITVGIREPSSKSPTTSRCRSLADVTIKICVPVVIFSFTGGFFYLGLN